MNAPIARTGILYASILVATALTLPGRAQQRDFPPLPESADVKTAPEPNRPFDAVVPRPAQAAGPALSARVPSQPPVHGAAGDPTPPALGALRVDHSRMHYDTPGDGSLWARGAAYKVSFDTAGVVTYFPLFGGRQPRHQPLSLSPDAVTLGGVPLALGAVPGAARNGDRVELDHGSFVEAYELAPQSMEQLFVFPALVGEGDLVVRIPIASAGEPIEVAETTERLEIRSELGRVGYGRAFAIDARGHRVEAPTSFEGGHITIRVDAGFLSTAAMPLVIDPVVSTFVIDSTSYDDGYPDVSYDATTQRWLVTFVEAAAGGDLDVYYTMLNATGTSMWGAYVNMNNASWQWPECANLNAADQFLVVSSVYSNGSWTIRGRTVQANIFSMGNEFQISGTESGNKYDFDVGGDPYPSTPSYYCVVYEREYDFYDHDILVRCVGPDSLLVGTSAVFLSNSGGTYDSQPSVSKSNGASNWTVAWERSHGYQSSDIWAGRIGYAGNVVNTPYQITAGSADSSVSVSSPLAGTQRVMIAFQRSFVSDNDIYAYVQDGTTPIASANITTLQNNGHFAKDQKWPSVDTDGSHFILAYMEAHVLGWQYDYDVYFDDLYLSGGTLGLSQSHVPVATTTSLEERPLLGSTHGSGGQTKRCMVVWGKELHSTNHDVHGALLDGAEGGAANGFCFGDGSGAGCPCGNNGASGRGCGNSVTSAGAYLGLTGTVSVGNDTAVLHASSMPATSVGLVFQGSSAGNPTPFGDGLRCTAGTILRLARRTASDGSISYPAAGDQPLHVTGGVPSNGGLRTYQVWYRDAATFCTSATSNITNGLLVLWAP